MPVLLGAYGGPLLPRVQGHGWSGLVSVFCPLLLGHAGLFFFGLPPPPQTNQYLDMAPSTPIMLQKWL